MNRHPVVAISATLFALAIICPFRLRAQAGEPGHVTLELNATPLAEALDRLQDASGLHLAFASDLVKDAEPVTLSAKDEPVDSVLRRILRPRGMEFIYTADTMAAIVPQASDAGMAKAAGRALRTFARLARKLEGAVQKGDEVRVPGWMGSDDRAVAEAALDMCASLYFFGRGRAKEDAPPDLARLVTAYDGDVRAGAFAAVTAGILPWESRPRLTPDRRVAALEPAVRKLLADPDPAVRGSGVIIALGLNAVAPGEWGAVLREATAGGAKDFSPGVRFAAALAAAFASQPGKAGGFDDTMVALRSDSCAAVRGVAWARWLSRMTREADADLAMREFIQALAAEKNPILRSAGALAACSAWEGNAARIRQLASSPAIDADPWLKLSAELFASCALADSGKPPPDAADAGQGSDQGGGALGRVADLMASGKRSHKALAALALAFAARRPGGKPDLSRIAALADSECVYVRLAAIVINGLCADAPSDARLLKALQSTDELDRIAALSVYALSERPGRADAAPPPNADALEQALLAASRAPRYAESTLAAAALPRFSSFAGALAAFQNEVRRNPRGSRARAMLDGFRKMPKARAELQEQRQMLIVDALLESGCAELQVYFLKNIGFLDYGLSPPLLLTVVCEAEPEAVFTLIEMGSQNLGIFDQLRNNEAIVGAMLDRLTAIFEAGGPKAAAAARCLAAYDGKVRYDRTLGPIAAALADRMLEACMHGGASNGELAAACELAASGHPSLGAIGSGAGVRLLELIGHKTLGPKAASMLGALYRRFDVQVHLDGYPALRDAMEAARAKLMSGKSKADQVLLLMEMVAARTEAVAAGSRAELARRIVTGEVPPGLRLDAVRAFGKYQIDVPPELAEFLMASLASRDEPREFNSAAMLVLRQCPSQFPALAKLFARMAKDGDRGSNTIAVFLIDGVREELRALKEQGKPAPDWAKTIADTARAIAGDAELKVYSRQEGLSLFACSAGADASGFLEAMALDEKQDPQVRSEAARSALQVNPQTTLLAACLQSYGKLPWSARADLGRAAARSMKAPGAEAFFLRFLKDPQLRIFQKEALNSLQRPASDSLLAGLKQFEQDPEIGLEVTKALQRLQPKQ